MAKRLLFIDTETTGLDPEKARLCEYASAVVELGRGVIHEWHTLVEPETVDQYPLPEATRVHGIDGDTMLAEGQPLVKVLEAVVADVDLVLQGDLLGLVVAHNIRYDSRVLAAEFARAGKLYPLNNLQPFCTMEAMTDRCRLPGRYGRYKWPSLKEAWTKCHPTMDWEELGSPHRAVFDVNRCMEIYIHGLANEWWHRG